MPRASTNIDSLARTFDRYLEAHVTPLLHRMGVQAALSGILVCGAIALALLPVRDSIGAANVALALALTVALVGAFAGPAPGLVTAGAASLLFATLHSVPHGLPTTEERQDALTAGLLLVTGLVSGLVHRRIARTMRLRELLDDDLGRLHRVAEVAVRTRDRGRVLDAVIVETSSELRLVDAFVEQGPPSREWRQLGHNGRIAGISTRDHEEHLGKILAEGVAVGIGPETRLVLVGDPDVHVDPRQMRVVVALADYATIVADSVP